MFMYNHISNCPYCGGSIIFKEIVYNAGVPVVKWQCNCCHKISPFYSIRTDNITDNTDCSYITTNTSIGYHTSSNF